MPVDGLPPLLLLPDGPSSPRGTGVSPMGWEFEQQAMAPTSAPVPAVAAIRRRSVGGVSGDFR
jgi:hypothetical protein